MTRRTLGLGVFLIAALALFPGIARAQNSQCTILSADNFGKVVPYTANPAPALNAPCTVGSDTGYISRTSSGIGVNANSRCTITVSGHTITVPYEGHPVPALKTPCRVGNVMGSITSTSAPIPPPPPPPNPPGGAGAIPVFYRWLPGANGSVPAGAVIGGWQTVQYQTGSTAVNRQGPYYVCRAAYQGSTFPGKVVNKSCNFSAANGKENLASSYEVLTAQSQQYSLIWQQTGAQPANAVVGGRWGQDLYLCQLPYQGGIHPGWVNQAQSGPNPCSIGYGGKEVDLPGFAYLIPIKGKPID